jgi:hypothetical protein
VPSQRLLHRPMATDALSILLFAASAAITTWSGLRIAAAASATRHERLLAAFVVSVAVIVISGELLALASMLNSRGAWMTAALLFGVVASRFKPQEMTQSNAFPALFRKWPVLAIAAAYIGLLLVAVLLPVNNFDAMSYHLARVGYYLQQGNFNFFETSDVHQVSLQLNAEILMLWTVAFLKRDCLAPLVQFAAAIAAAIAIFGIARHFGIPRIIAMLAAMVVLGFPQVALQATAAKNDLFSSAMAVAGVYFILAFQRSASLANAAFAGASIGIAAGTKATVWLLFPGILTLLLYAATQNGRMQKNRLCLLGAAMFLGVMLFTLPHIVRTQVATGSPIMTGVPITVGRITHASFVSNAVRFCFDMIGAADLPHPAHRWVVDAKQEAGSRLLSPDWLHAPESTFRDTRFVFGAGNLTEDSAWFGVSGMIIFGCACVAAVWALIRRRMNWLAYAAAPAAFIVSFLVLIRWQPWAGRFLIATMVLAVPMGLKGIALVVSGQRRVVRRAAWVILCMLAVSGSAVSLLQNRYKPLVRVEGFRTVWRLSREEQRCRRMPSDIALLRFVNSIVPARIGFFAPGLNWDRILFGEDYRHFIHRYKAMPDLREVFAKNECDIFLLNFDIVDLPRDSRVVTLNETWQVLLRKDFPWPPEER